jgi:hypothetical protein
MVDSSEDVEALTGTASPDGSAGLDPGAVHLARRFKMSRKLSLEMRATLLYAPAFCQFAQSTARFVQDDHNWR